MGKRRRTGDAATTLPPAVLKPDDDDDGFEITPPPSPAKDEASRIVALRALNRPAGGATRVNCDIMRGNRVIALCYFHSKLMAWIF